MTVTAPFTRTADFDRAQAVSIGDIAIERRLCSEENRT